MAAFTEGSIVEKTVGERPEGTHSIRLGHPSGVMTVYPDLSAGKDGSLEVKGVAVQRTARRIMDGTIYIRN